MIIPSGLDVTGKLCFLVKLRCFIWMFWTTQFAHLKSWRTVPHRLPCLKRMSEQILSKLVWRWKQQLVISNYSYQARVSGGQIHTQNHTQKKAQWASEQSELRSMARWSLFSAIGNLAWGTSDLALPSEMGRPQRTCHTETPGFLSLLGFLVNLRPQGFGLSRNSSWLNKTTKSFPPTRLKHKILLYTFIFLMQEE